jgi:hypothetical protein
MCFEAVNAAALTKQRHGYLEQRVSVKFVAKLDMSTKEVLWIFTGCCDAGTIKTPSEGFSNEV